MPPTDVSATGSEESFVKVGGVSEGEGVTTLIASSKTTSELTPPVQPSPLYARNDKL